MVEFLVGAGLNYNLNDIEGWSPLDLAKHHRNEDAIKIMLNHHEHEVKFSNRKAAKQELADEKRRVES